MSCGRLWILLLYLVSSDLVVGRTRSIRNLYGQRCATKLESALDTTLRRSQQRSGSSSLIDFSESGSQRQSLFNRSPYNSYDEDLEQIVSEYKQKYHNPAPGGSFFPPSGMSSTSQVEVANLKVRIPQNHQWVVVDRCQFTEQNRTLDTKLEFPDLQISGRVIMHPTGGRCDMILRLRRAGIEFRTIPLLPSATAGERSRQANVRTDSHFSEPGFISVFAHSCEGPTGIKYRINSKRRHFLNKQQSGAAGYYARERRRVFDVDADLDVDPEAPDIDGGDLFRLNDGDTLFLSPNSFVDVGGEGSNAGDDDPNSRTFFTGRNPYSYASYAGGGANGAGNTASGANYANSGWQNVETNEALDDAYSKEIDNLFSKGVRGLLTTYMQKALQPAIKETLMESMGYTLSYG